MSVLNIAVTAADRSKHICGKKSHPEWSEQCNVCDDVTALVSWFALRDMRTDMHVKPYVGAVISATQT